MPNTFKKILLPTDGGDVALRAAGHAVALAKLCGVPLHLVFVHEPYPYIGVGSTNAAGVVAYDAEARQHADQAFWRIGEIAQLAGVAVTSALIEGKRTAQAIADAAEELGADLIVMGSHGRSGVARVLLGSVAAQVLVLSKVPVMVVR